MKENAIFPFEEALMKKPSHVENNRVGEVFSSFLDTIGSATSRATFYNTKKEQEEVVQKVHKDLLNIDRGVIPFHS